LDEQFSIFDFGAEPLEAVDPKIEKPRLRLMTRAGVQLALAAGKASLVLDEDGLVSRIVHPHSREKAHIIRRYAEMVGTGMRRAWGGRLWWVDLHAGPAQLFEDDSGEYLSGSPKDALMIKYPFQGYVFVEYDEQCAHALAQRVSAYPNTHVIAGDANSSEVHDQIAALVPRTALVVIYADPEDLDDFDFKTVRYFTERYPHVDWLINFPVSSAARFLSSPHGANAVVPMIEHERPSSLVAARERRTAGSELRVFFQRQLEALGYTCRHETIYVAGHVPLYDVFLATRDKTGRALDYFDKACGIKASGQRTLFDLSVGSESLV
jgi:three-Cys-motif partner protein